MAKNKFSMALLGASAAFVLVSGVTQAQNMSNQNAATGTSSNTSAQAASNPNAATMGAGQTRQSGQNMQGSQQMQGGQHMQGGHSASTAGQSGSQGATASGAGAGALSKADQKLVRDMAMMNMAEIESARMAQSKSQSDTVKTYAQRMIDDHTKALSEVQQLAQAKGVTLPTELDKAHKAKGAKLAKLSGEQFDRAYMAQAGVNDHKQAHAKLQTAASKAKDPDLKALAGRLNPTVEDHLKMARDHHGNMKAGATGSSGSAGTTGSGSGATGSGMTGSDKSQDKR